MVEELIVVEDSDEDFELLSDTCRQIGFKGHLRRFADAESALAFVEEEIAARRHPRLVLLDLSLPGMDGRDFLARVKLDEAMRTVPIAVYTTSSNINDIKFCYEHHANSFHVKPIGLRESVDEVKAILDYWFSHVVPPDGTITSFG